MRNYIDVTDVDWLNSVASVGKNPTAVLPRWHKLWTRACSKIVVVLSLHLLWELMAFSTYSWYSIATYYSKAWSSNAVALICCCQVISKSHRSDVSIPVGSLHSLGGFRLIVLMPTPKNLKGVCSSKNSLVQKRPFLFNVLHAGLLYFFSDP